MDGIVGYVRSGANIIRNCSNESNTIIGKINNYISTGQSGGILGGYSGSSWEYDLDLQIQNCYNKGKIYSSNYCGGILGGQYTVAKSINLNINNCYTIGEINGDKKGAVVGCFTQANKEGTTTSQSITNVYYLNSLSDSAIKNGECRDASGELVETSMYALSDQALKGEVTDSNVGKNIIQALNENSEGEIWKTGDDGYPALKE